MILACVDERDVDEVDSSSKPDPHTTQARQIGAFPPPPADEPR